MPLGPRAISAGIGSRHSIDWFDQHRSDVMCARRGERTDVVRDLGADSRARAARHRPWTRLRGNLAASVLEVLDVSPSIAATLGFAAGLALRGGAAEGAVSKRRRAWPDRIDEVFLKWPNDVLAGRRKLAGILLEAEAVAAGRLAVVVGIGTNVVAAPSGHADARDVVGGARRPDQCGAIVHRTVGRLGRIRGIWDNGAGGSAKSGSAGLRARPGLARKLRSRPAAPHWRGHLIRLMRPAA